MESIKEVYNNLKKHDDNNNLILTIKEDEEILMFKYSENKQIIIWNDYLGIEQNGKELTHWHPNYDEMYLYILKLMYGQEKFPTKKEINKPEYKFYFKLIFMIIMIATFYSILNIKLTFWKFIVSLIVLGIIYYYLKKIIKLIINKLNNNHVYNTVYPQDAAEPDLEPYEVNRLYNCDKRRIIFIYKKNGNYSYDVLIKKYDDFDNKFFWSPLNTIGVSIFDTKEKAINDALLIYPLNSQINIRHLNINEAYFLCFNNKEAFTKEQKVGCIYCLNKYNSSDIKVWLKDEIGTAICPYCGMNSVIGESSGYSVTKEFLKEMNARTFKTFK